MDIIFYHKIYSEESVDGLLWCWSIATERCYYAWSLGVKMSTWVVNIFRWNRPIWYIQWARFIRQLLTPGGIGSLQNPWHRPRSSSVTATAPIAQCSHLPAESSFRISNETPRNERPHKLTFNRNYTLKNMILEFGQDQMNFTEN